MFSTESTGHLDLGFSRLIVCKVHDCNSVFSFDESEASHWKPRVDMDLFGNAGVTFVRRAG